MSSMTITGPRDLGKVVETREGWTEVTRKRKEPVVEVS